MNTRHKSALLTWEVGQRVRWPGESVWGTVTAVVWRGRQGWAVLVDWDDGAPDWWASELSASARLQRDEEHG